MVTQFPAALCSFVSGCQTIHDTHSRTMFPHADNLVGVNITTTRGKSFIKVIRTDSLKSSGELMSKSVHCFVAIDDGNNKKMGSWKAGDVFKAAGWGTPAKGARGNIFDNANGLSRMTEYGPEYNR